MWCWTSAPHVHRLVMSLIASASPRQHGPHSSVPAKPPSCRRATPQEMHVSLMASFPRFWEWRTIYSRQSPKEAHPSRLTYSPRAYPRAYQRHSRHTGAAGKPQYQYRRSWCIGGCLGRSYLIHRGFGGGAEAGEVAGHLAHRALPPLRAIAWRSFADRVFARALPPRFPPLEPKWAAFSLVNVTAQSRTSRRVFQSTW